MKNLPYFLYLIMFFGVGITNSNAQIEPKGIQAASAKSIPASEKLGYIGYDPLPVTEVKFYSESLQREMYINVVLPRGYKKSKLNYPVLYLCHGYTSNYHEFEYIGVKNGARWVACDWCGKQLEEAETYKRYPRCATTSGVITICGNGTINLLTKAK